MEIGISGYGAYIPTYRIKTAEIARVWGEDEDRIVKGLGIKEKAVAYVDEDAATMAVEAARRAVESARIDPSKIGAIYVGSESHPYAVKPTAATVGAGIGAGPRLMSVDTEFACKAGTSGLQAMLGFVSSGMIDYGMAIGSDTAQGKPGDMLEYSAGCGSAAFIAGKDNVIAEFVDTYSYSTDTPDFWRRPKADYPSHGARFTGEPAYFAHMRGAIEGVLEKADASIKEVDYFVFHQPNYKFPMVLSKKLGIPKEKVAPGLVVDRIGNTYSAASLIGFANVLDMAEPEQTILLCSFGSGAGSDAFIFRTTDSIEERKKITVDELISDKRYIDYATYLKFRNKIRKD